MLNYQRVNFMVYHHFPSSNGGHWRVVQHSCGNSWVLDRLWARRLLAAFQQGLIFGRRNHWELWEWVNFFWPRGAAKFDLFLKLRSNWIDRDLILTQTHTKISLKVWGLEHDWSRKSWRINKNWRLKECIGQLTSKNGDSTSKNGDSTSKNGDSTSKNGDSTGKRWGCNELKWVYHGLSPSTVGMQEWLVSK